MFGVVVATFPASFSLDSIFLINNCGINNDVLMIINDVIRGKALKSGSFVLNEFSQIANIEPKLNTYCHRRG